MLLLGGASQPIKRRVFVLPPLRWDCSDSANQEMYALPRCKDVTGQKLRLLLIRFSDSPSFDE
ncbi:hypothetical protein Bca4012_089332 [Brassica carinata]